MARQNDQPESTPQSSELYKLILTKFHDLETSHAKLTEQFDVLVQEKEQKESQQRSRRLIGYGPGGESGGGGVDDEIRGGGGGGGGGIDDEDVCWGELPSYVKLQSPYSSVLQCIGHAVYVCRANNYGDIIFWNRSAELLFGWKAHEVIGENVSDLLIEECNWASIENIMDRLRTGRSSSGQFPFKKKSGEIFMALMTKSPLYEDGELAGIITVSSDAAVFNRINSENQRMNRDCANGKPSERVFDLKRLPWHPQPLTASAPHISSSVSNLASKIFPRRCGENDTEHTISRYRGEKIPDADDTDSDKERKYNFRMNLTKDPTIGHIAKEEPILKFVQPTKLAAKVIEKLRIGVNGNDVQEENTYVPPQGSTYIPGNNSIGYVSNLPGVANRDKELLTANKNSLITSWLEGHDCSEVPKISMGKEGVVVCNPDKLIEKIDAEAVVEMKPPIYQPLGMPGTGDGACENHDNRPTKCERDSNLVSGVEIRWEDLHLGDEIGQGSFAAVFRGIWNGSDVAIKVYFGSEYREATLLDYNKEIAIMKSLRHPNVLLFMGAVYSPERLAIVTEFLPRGSLFRTLHKSNQTLDIRRRLRMALDVARGMNYLHKRNPPIVHRDLKSSNLLVHRNWTVKVGDFGLSKWKNSTFLTARSGRGTPQWMAPEVLRNEPSNEKCDVFSFGIILWELITVSIPWKNLNPLQVVGIVGFMDRRLDLPQDLDPRIASMIEDCWQSQPNLRPSFEQLIQRMSSLIQSYPPLPVRKGSEA